MLTPEGRRRAALAICQGAIIRVSDGQFSADAATSIVLDDAGATITATFTSEQANFDWRARAVIAPDGAILDEAQEDMGRKAPGREWTIDVRLEMA